ncbi:microfibrillar-associated protein 1 [Stomoxys calcitrans]|uniref:Micro-fibrillar-associated protein 1 C-terminal domain-containing protein n=1 Tax=Stomoxys calcitrans TaxID=35570 RepID=A0A1I8NVM0_STOCA|nr:microfibrillar-associated protein 1 [Stomoxys calcitrans]
MNNPTLPAGIQSTAGAIAVRNEKGEISMQKVKVQRYISGKRPDYAKYDSSSEGEDNEDFLEHRRRQYAHHHHERRQHREIKEEPQREDKEDEKKENRGVAKEDEEEDVDDPRLRRLRARPVEQDELAKERMERHRHIHEPEFLEESDSEDDEEQQVAMQKATNKITLASESDSDSDISESELENRRLKLRQRMLQQQKEEEILQKEEEKQSESSDTESSEYEEETESEEDNEPRLKPLFVRKKDRATIQEKEREAQKQKQLEIEAKRLAKERRRNTLRLVEESVKKDLEKTKNDTAEPQIEDVCTDDENDEVEYEAWKLRELKRMKRDREERENTEREKSEIERMRNLGEDERRQEMRINPKIVTNKAVKGKYKFLQKYYHRGAFYLDEENDVLKRDFAQATLEDHFDKTILPKVMQVKNFGRCGRTKYTHLVDQDTTKFDSPWYAETANNLKFHSERGGGMKQVFDKPSQSKRKKMD